MSTTLVQTVRAFSVTFGVYGFVKEQFAARGYSEKSAAATICAGGTGGVLGAATTFPLDVIRRRQQVMGGEDVRRSLAEEARHILRTEGPAGLFRGFRPDMLRTFPAIA